MVFIDVPPQLQLRFKQLLWDRGLKGTRRLAVSPLVPAGAVQREHLCDQGVAGGAMSDPQCYRAVLAHP